MQHIFHLFPRPVPKRCTFLSDPPTSASAEKTEAAEETSSEDVNNADTSCNSVGTSEVTMTMPAAAESSSSSSGEEIPADTRTEEEEEPGKKKASPSVLVIEDISSGEEEGETARTTLEDMKVEGMDMAEDRGETYPDVEVLNNHLPLNHPSQVMLPYSTVNVKRFFTFTQTRFPHVSDQYHTFGKVSFLQ